MAKAKRSEPLLILADGREGVRRFATRIWYDLRLKNPVPWSQGFPKEEIGSIRTASWMVMSGRAARVQCVDRVLGRVQWTVEKGQRVPGTHLYEPIISHGDPQQRGRRRIQPMGPSPANRKETP